jgi:hypothetical protein
MGTTDDEDGPVTTPDGRYLLVRGRLWRRSDPRLAEERRAELVHELMDARRAKKAALASDDSSGVESARRRVDAAKVALGERGPVWWDDGAPDENRRLARTSSYAEWFAGLSDRAEPPPHR